MAAVSLKYIELLMLGMTGNGKSATGNSILGRRSFKSSPSATSVTKNVQVDYSQIDENLIIKVTDLPGVEDTDNDEEGAVNLIINSVKKAITANPGGYHAFLIVARFGRFTKGDINTIKVLKGIFGPDFVKKFCILVITNGDSFDPEECETESISEWCDKQDGVLKSLYEECSKRVVLFDNKTKDKGAMNRQRVDLLRKVEKVSILGLKYTDKHFQHAQNERDKLLLEMREPMIREESLREVSLITQQLGEIQLDNPNTQLKRLDVLKARSKTLLQSVLDQDMETGALRDSIEHCRNIQETVEEHIKYVHMFIEREETRRKNRERLDRLREEQEKKLREDERAHLEEEIAYMEKLNRESKAREHEMANNLRDRNRSLQTGYMNIDAKYHKSMEDSVAEILGHALIAGAGFVINKVL